MKNIFPIYKFLNSDIEYQVITLENKDLLAQYMLSNNKKRLIITSDSVGWNEITLPDLKEFYFIEELLVYWTNIKNIDGIHLCKNLKILWLDNNDKTEVFFENFPALEKVITWDRKGLERIWNVNTIKELTIAAINKKHFQGAQNAIQIEKLRILKSSLDDISFLSTYKQMTFLELLDINKLEDLQPIENLLRLKHVRIIANKASNFSFIKKLKQIETCFLSSKIAEFRMEYFKDLTELKKINLSGNASIQNFNRELQKKFNEK